jgi:hypothetical protein
MPTMNLTNLLVSPTLLILIAASAALLVSIGVLLVMACGTLRNRQLGPPEP